MKDRKFKKNQETRNKYVDPNSLKESGDSSNPYLKELAALAAILGTGATGAAILPNDRVYAAQTSVDAKSQIVGSVSESTQTDLSKRETVNLMKMESVLVIQKLKVCLLLAQRVC